MDAAEDEIAHTPSNSSSTPYTPSNSSTTPYTPSHPKSSTRVMKTDGRGVVEEALTAGELSGDVGEGLRNRTRGASGSVDNRTQECVETVRSGAARQPIHSRLFSPSAAIAGGGGGGGGGGGKRGGGGWGGVGRGGFV